jgi:hypothetical protein
MDEFSALAGDAELAAEECLCGCRSEAHERLGLNKRDLCSEPWQARVYVFPARFFVDSSLALSLVPTKVFDGVREINLASFQARIAKHVVEEATCGADERPSLVVFAVAGLFADKHYACGRGSLAKDGLSTEPP